MFPVPLDVNWAASLIALDDGKAKRVYQAVVNDRQFPSKVSKHPANHAGVLYESS